MKHAPTPYSWDTHHQLSGETECLKGAGVKTVLSWGRRPNREGVEYTYISVSKEDAAFIVEACNAYEKHVQQIQHLDSAVKAQASTVARFRSILLTISGKAIEEQACRCDWQETEGRCLRCRAKEAIALCEEVQ